MSLSDDRCGPIALSPLSFNVESNTSATIRELDIPHWVSTPASATKQISGPSLPPSRATDAEDEPVSNTYRVMLLMAGFMMTFQTIGINQSYGIFQVRVFLYLPKHARPKVNPHPLPRRNSTPPWEAI